MADNKATTVHVLGFDAPAAADYSTTGQYRAVKLNSSGKWELCSTLGERADGILQDDPEADEVATVWVLGLGEAVAGATIARGDELTTDAAGALIPITDASHHRLGRAMEPAASGENFSFLVMPSDAQAGLANEKVIKSWSVDAADVADGDLITAWTPDFAGTVDAVDVTVEKAVTTGGAGSTLNAEIGTTNLTGGVVTLSGTYALGAEVAGTAVTAANTFTDSDTISIEASSTTPFTEGRFNITLTMSRLQG